jgi:hypothetical protein
LMPWAPDVGATTTRTTAANREAIFIGAVGGRSEPEAGGR